MGMVEAGAAMETEIQRPPKISRSGGNRDSTARSGGGSAGPTPMHERRSPGAQKKKGPIFTR
jgi:hypothetical protein